MSTSSSTPTITIVTLRLHFTVTSVTLHSHCNYFYFFLSLAPTAPPTNFVISALNSTALSLAWSPPPLEHRHGFIIKYTLTCHETINGSSYLVTSPVFPYTINNNSSVDLVLNGFRPGTTINCSVTASNEVGTGPAAHKNITTQEEG